MLRLVRRIKPHRNAFWPIPLFPKTPLRKTLYYNVILRIISSRTHYLRHWYSTRIGNQLLISVANAAAKVAFLRKPKSYNKNKSFFLNKPIYFLCPICLRPRSRPAVMSMIVTKSIPVHFRTCFFRRITAYLDPFTVINLVRGTTIDTALHWTEPSLPRAPFEIS